MSYLELVMGIRLGVSGWYRVFDQPRTVSDQVW